MMSNRDDPNSNNKSQLRVMDDTQLQSVARSLRDSTNGMYILDTMVVLAMGGVGGWPGDRGRSGYFRIDVKCVVPH